MNNSNQNIWNSIIPWFLTIACIIVLFIIGRFLVTNIEWFKSGVFDKNINDINTSEYRFYAYHLHLSMIKRSIGLFSGFILLFLGLGVAYYTTKGPTTLNIEGQGLKTKIMTASPGLIVLIIGAILIIFTIQSKDTFPYFTKEIAPKNEINAPLQEDVKLLKIINDNNLTKDDLENLLERKNGIKKRPLKDKIKRSGENEDVNSGGTDRLPQAVFKDS